MAPSKGKIFKANSGNLKWFQNAARSLGYSSTDLIKEMLPSTTEFAVNTSKFTQEIISDARDFRKSGNSYGKSLNDNDQVKIAKDALKNAISDIKSGKIYNKERQHKVASNEDEFDMGGLDDDFGMADFSIDMDDDEIMDSDSNTKVIVPKITVKNIQPPISKNNPMVKVMENQSKAIIASANATNDINMAIASNQMVLNRKLGTATLQGIESINDNLSMLVNFQSESMSKYIGASLKYYEENIDLMRQSLDEIKKSTVGYGGGRNNSTFTSNDPLEDVFELNGSLNMRGYMNMVKRNFKNQFDSNPLLQPLKSMFEETDTLKYLAASPLSFIATKVTTTLIPTFLQKTMAEFDKSLTSFFPALLMRFNRGKGDNMFTELLSEIFGIKTRSKSTIDLSRYDKGPVPFDGLTKKSIVEVIPTYLRKILSAVSGEHELGYDYDKGQFQTIRQMKKKHDGDRDRAILNAFDESLNSINDRSQAFLSANLDERKEFQEGIEKFFVSLAKQEKLVRPQVYMNKDGEEVDELASVYDFKGNTGMLNLFRNLILTMPKNQQRQLFGANVIEARKAVVEFMTEIEKDPTKNNGANLFNLSNLKENAFDAHLQYNPKTGEYEKKKGFGNGNPVDRFNMTVLDYTRDIKSILLKGIRVYTTNLGNVSLNGERGELPSVLSDHAQSLTTMKKQVEKYNENQKKKNTSLGDAPDLTDDELDRIRARGQKDIYSYDDLSLWDNSSIQEQLIQFDEKNLKNSKKGGFMQWVGKFFSGNTQDKYNLLREKIDSLLQKPAMMLNSVFTQIDNVMHRIIFGKDGDEDGEGPSFFTKTMAIVRNRFDRVGEYVQEKILSPLKESLFGKEGIITKIKDSDMMESMKERMKNIGNFMFGKTDGSGKRSGGMMSDTANSLADMWDGMKYYFTGRAYTNRAGIKFGDNRNSVFGEVQNMFGNFKDTIKHYLVGDKKNEDTDQRRGILSGIIDGMKNGFYNFQSALFGPRMMNGKEVEGNYKELAQKIKERAPKAMAAGIVGSGVGIASALGSFGMLGSLILPGGPIGGAIVGTTLGFLSQSDQFKNWLFGPKDANNQRLGGVINQSTQDFLKKNRVGIIGGASLGAAKSMFGFGLLPSFFMPGGAIGGAVLGMGTSMLVRSESFQKMMFGEKDIDGKRMGGIVQKAFGSVKNGKNLMGNTAVGALGGSAIGLVASKMGLLGAMLVPGGPIGGAILGAATGIALSSDRWKKALFGEWDDETGLRKGGMLGKFQNWFTLEIQEPLKQKFADINLNMKEWFTKAVANPFRDALEPIKTEFKYMTTRMTEMFKNGWDSFKEKIGDTFEKHVGQPFGLFMKEKVMDPLKGFFNKIIGGVGKVFKTIFAAPFSAMQQMSMGLREKQMRRGLRTYQDEQWDDIKDTKGRRERGERMGVFNTRDKEGNVVNKGFFGRMRDMYFNSETRDEARYGEHGAHYAKAEEERIAKRDQEQSATFEEERKALDKKRKQLDLRRKLGLKYDYDNFDEDGKNISKIYDIPVIKSMIKSGLVTGHRNIEDKVGSSITELFGEGTTADNLTKAQKKQLSKAIRKGMKGQTAKEFFNIGNDAVEEQVSTIESVATNDTTAAPIVHSVENMTEKLSETLKSESAKPEINEKVLPTMKETNTHLSNILEKIKDVITGSNEKPKHTSDPAPISKPKSMRLSTKRNVEGEIEDDSRESQVSNDYEVHYKRTMKKTPKDSGTLLQRIAADVRTIAQEVHGQLDGVGSNVFKIRKLTQQQSGLGDADITGSANRDRLGFMGKLRRALFKPMDLIKEKLFAGVQFVTNKIKAFGEGVAKVSKAILSIPVNIAKSMVAFTKELGQVAKETAIAIVKLPGKLLDIVGASLKATAETIKMVGPAIGESLKGVAKIFSGAMGMAAHSMIGFGKGLGNLFVELGKGTGQIVAQLSKTAISILGSASKLITGTLNTIASGLVEASKQTMNFVFGMTQQITSFTLGTVKMVGEKLLDVGDSLLKIVASPLKFLASGVGKLLGTRQEVVVVGGVLDAVRQVQYIGGKKIPEINEKTFADGKKDFARKVRKVADEGTKTHDGEIVTDKGLDCECIARAITKLLPLPVKMAQDPTTTVTPQTALLNEQTTELSAVNPVTAGVGLADTVVNALSSFDEINDAKEQEKVDRQAFQNKIEEKSQAVKGKTAENLLSQLSIKDEKEAQQNAQAKQINLLEKIAGSTTEHKTGWMDIFGKTKGIVTLALLAALPFLKQIVTWLKKWIDPDNPLGPDGGLFPNGLLQLGEDPTKRQDADGTIIKNGAYRESLVKGGARKLTQLARANEKVIRKTIVEGGTVARAVANTANRVKNSKLGDWVGDKWNNMFKGDTAAAVVDAVNPNTVTALLDGPSPTAYLNEGASYIDDAARALTQQGQRVLPGPTANTPDVSRGGAPHSSVIGGGNSKSALKESTSKIMGDIVDAKFVELDDNGKVIKAAQDTNVGKIVTVIENLFKKFFNLGAVKEKLGKNASDVASKVMGVFNKVFNFQTIKKNFPKLAPKIFVNAAKSTGKVALNVATAGLTQVAFTAYDLTSGGFEAARIFRIHEDNVDGKMRIAAGVTKALFGCFPFIDILVEIFNEQTGHSMKQYVAEIIYAVLASKEDMADLDLAEAEFETEKDAYNKANNTNLSLNAYNDKQNKTVWQKFITDPVGKAWGGVKNGAGWVADKVGTAASWTGGKIGAAASWTGEKIGAAAKGVGNFVGNRIGLTDEAVKKNMGLEGDGKITTGMRAASFSSEALEKASFGLIDSEKTSKAIYGAGILIGEFADNVKTGINDNLVKPFDEKWDDTKKSLSEGWEKMKLAGDIMKDNIAEDWDGLKENLGETIGGIKENTSKVWGSLKDSVGGTWDSVTGSVSESAGNIKKSTSEKWENFKTTLDEKWDEMPGPVKKLVEGIREKTEKTWDAITEPIDAFKKLTDKDGAIYKKLNKWKDNITDIIDSITSPFKKAKESLEKKADKILENMGWGSGSIPSNKKSFGKGGPSSQADRENYEGVYGSGNVQTEMVDGVPYYSQKDSRWSGKKFGAGNSNPTFGQAGCGPTSAAMVMSAVTGKQVDPMTAYNFANENGFTDPQRGTSSDMFDAFGQQYGVNMMQASGTPDSIQQGLAGNNPIILRGEGGRNFTDKGHFVVATGMTNDGRVKISDPLGKNKSKVVPMSSLTQETTSSYIPMPQYANGEGNATMGEAMQMFGAGAIVGTGIWSGYKITSGYGYRNDPFTHKREFHTGIDLVKFHRAPIPAFTGGIVVHAKTGVSGSGYGNYGKTVAITDENGFTHIYAHLDAINVKVNQRVNAGTIVGLQGSTGRSTGSHVHYEVRKGGYGTHVDPGNYLNQYKEGKGSIFGDADSPNGGYSIDGEEEELGFFEIMGKMTENFSNAITAAYTGEKQKLEWGDTVKEQLGTENHSTLDSSGNFTLSNFVPKTTKDKILKKTVELTVANESNGNYFHAANDKNGSTGAYISPSVGINQWRGNHVKTLMNQIYQQMPRNADAKYYATEVNWNNNAPWSSSAQGKLQHFLASNPSIVKKVQDDYLLSYIRDTNLAPVYKHGVDTKKIADPRSIVMLGEFANTGPANVKKFMNRYSKGGTLGKEWNHFLNEFMGKSFWGPKSLYRSRIEKDKKALKNWNPESGKGWGMGGGHDPQAESLMKKSQAKLTRQDKESARAFMNRIPSEFALGTAPTPNSTESTSRTIDTTGTSIYTESYMTQSASSSNTITRVFNSILNVLTQIAGNTGLTAKQLQSMKVAVNGGSESNTAVITPVLVSDNSTSVQPVTVAKEQAHNSKLESDYRVANAIASGRF